MQNFGPNYNADNIPFNSGAIDASECVKQGWRLIEPKYWLFLGMVILAIIIGGCIPVVQWFLIGPITVGVYYAMLTQMRGEAVSFEMLFKGFSNFVPAMVIGLIV
jgi:uncharacterized membrane protein